MPQVPQALHADCPPSLEYVPKPHDSHAAWPAAVWNFPALQSAQPVFHAPSCTGRPSDLYVPFAHAVQVPDEAPPQLSRRVPGAHVSQLLQPELPSSSWNAPAAQAAQCEALERGKAFSP